MSQGLIIDNFAGGGGASTGIEAALGRSVDVAINHDDAAVAMHKANHPNTVHYSQSVWSVDPLDVTGGKPVDLAWFSPDCTHFSKARGGKPRKKHIRDLAWIVVHWIERLKENKPRIIMLENVEEFKDWGPLCSENKPIPEQKGFEFTRWLKALKKNGYKVEFKELRACDYGAPTIRKRLFLIARCDGLPIVWPQPTHGSEGSGLLSYRTAASIIDWSVECRSIFRERPLALNTRNRIGRGMKKFVLDAEEPFIVTYYGPKHENDFRGLGVSGTLPTQTTENRFALVTPFVQHIQHASATNGTMPCDEPLRTVTAKPDGGGMALVSAFLAKHYGGVTGVDIRTPFPTVTTRGTQNTIISVHLERQFGNSIGAEMQSPMPTVMPGGSGKTSLVTSHLTKFRGTCQHGQSVNEPMPTITAGGQHVGEVRACLIKYFGCGDNSCSVKNPLPTVTSKDRFGLVRAETIIPTCLTEEQRLNAWWTVRFLEEHGAIPEAEEFTDRPSFLMLGDYILWDIGMRMLTARELFRAQGFPESYIIDPEFNGKPLNKTQQVAKCGNSVCPPVVEALVLANVPQEMGVAV